MALGRGAGSKAKSAEVLVLEKELDSRRTVEFYIVSTKPFMASAKIVVDVCVPRFDCNLRRRCGPYSGSTAED